MSKSGTLVSIVMPSRNTAKYLEGAILSVLNQDYPNIELLVIDGGSTDGSVDILRKYAVRLGHWESRPDGGCVQGINRGFALCRGDLVGVLPSDDALYPDAVSRKVAVFTRLPDVDCVYGDVEQIDAKGTRLHVRYGKALPFRRWVRTCGMPVGGTQSCLWRRSVMERVGVFRAEMGVASDWDFLLRVGLRCRMEYLPGIDACFRYHGTSQSMTKQLDWVTLVPQMYEQFFRRQDLPGNIRRLRAQGVANAYLYAGFVLREQGLWKDVRRQLFRAIRTYPPLLLSRRFLKLLMLYQFPAARSYVARRSSARQHVLKR